jgi:hypothetical protein
LYIGFILRTCFCGPRGGGKELIEPGKSAICEPGLPYCEISVGML